MDNKQWILVDDESDRLGNFLSGALRVRLGIVDSCYIDKQDNLIFFYVQKREFNNGIVTLLRDSLNRIKTNLGAEYEVTENTGDLKTLRSGTQYLKASFEVKCRANKGETACVSVKIMACKDVGYSADKKTLQGLVAKAWQDLLQRHQKHPKLVMLDRDLPSIFDHDDNNDTDMWVETFNKDKLGDSGALVVVSKVSDSDPENRLKSDGHAPASLVTQPEHPDSPWGKLHTAWKQRTDPDSYWRKGRKLVEDLRNLSANRFSKRDLAHMIQNIEVGFLVTSCKEELANKLPRESGGSKELNDEEFDFFAGVLEFRRSLFGMLGLLNGLSDDRNWIYHPVFDAWTFDGESPLFWVTRALLEIERIWGKSEVNTGESILDLSDPRNLSRFSNFGNGNKQDMDKFRDLLIQLIREASAKQRKERFFYGIDLIMSNERNNCPIGLKILLGSTDKNFREIVSNPESFDYDSSRGNGGRGFRRTLTDLAIQVKNMGLCIKANENNKKSWEIEIKSGVGSSNE